ncbi:hypothetical protein [Dermabacter hominis]|uniref:hypothetical protein n=1 Tax=Dermabacter hominis TaxID=36740 RepID=UPI00159C0DF1|nr:hypothetical protein [Dermabacter hominis]
MVSKSDLPELDDPGTVSQLGAKFVAIGMLNKSIIDEAKYGWTDIATSYQAPESGKVQRVFHTPSEAADELERRTKKVGDALDSYSNTLSDLHTEKAQIESDIDAANAKYAEAMAMPEKVEEPDPDNPGETIEKDNEEREQALAEANQMISAAEGAVRAFKFKVQQEDRSLADSITGETINPHTGEAAWSNFAGGSFFKGVFDAIIGMPKIIVGTVRINVSDVWNHRHDLKNFFFGPDGARHRQFWLQMGTLLAPPGMGAALGTVGTAPEIVKGAQDGSLKRGAFTAGKWVYENLQDAAMGPASPSVYIHGEAWLRKWGTETAHDPAYTIGGLAPTVVTGGLSVELKAGQVVVKNLTKPGEKAVKKGLKDAAKKAYEDPAREAFNNGIYDSLKEAYGSQGEQGAAPSAPAPAPAPAEQPAPAPAPAPAAPAPAPAPAPVAPAPVAPAPAPAPVDQPAPAPAPAPAAPAPAPVAPAPAPAPVAPAPAPVDKPAPAPAPVDKPAPAPAPAPAAPAPAPAPAAPAPAPAPVNQPAPAPAPAPRPVDPVADALETLGNASHHDFFEFRNDLIDQISAIDGIDGDAVRAFADDPEGFAQGQANQAYEDFLSANPEVKQLVP